MSTEVLTSAGFGRRIVATTATTGLWRAMTERVRCTESLSTVEVAELAPRQSMFGYDPSEAIALTELPDGI